MNTSELIKAIKRSIKKDFGKSAAQMKAAAKSTINKNATASDFFKGNGYCLFYTTNKNFAGGRRNGYGSGFYARVNIRPGLTAEVRIG